MSILLHMVGLWPFHAAMTELSSSDRDIMSHKAKVFTYLEVYV